MPKKCERGALHLSAFAVKVLVIIYITLMSMRFQKAISTFGNNQKIAQGILDKNENDFFKLTYLSS